VPALVVLAIAAIRTRPRRRAWLTGAAGVGFVVSIARPRQTVDMVYTALLSEWLFVRGWQMVIGQRTEVLWDQEKRTVVPGAAWTNSKIQPTSRPSATREAL
jgi:hypothetical protein